MFSVTLLVLEILHRMPISLRKQPAIVDFRNYSICRRKQE